MLNFFLRCLAELIGNFCKRWARTGTCVFVDLITKALIILMLQLFQLLLSGCSQLL